MKAREKGSAALFALLLVAALAVTACDTGAGGEFVTYTGDAGGVRYTLTVTENAARYAAQVGDRYELVRESRRSAGTVSDVNGSLLTLQPENAPDTTFTASVSGGRLTALNGRITWTDGSTASAPGRMTGSTYYPPYSPPSTANPDVWRVVYDANGGEGDMPDDTAEVGTAITLSANTFTRTGCTFAGWAESAAGAKPHNAGDTVYAVSGASDMNQTDDTTLDIYALWKVDNATEVVNDAANKGGGTALTLTGVAWDDIKDVVESALSDRVTTLDLSGVSGFEEEWDKDTLTNKGNIISLTLPETVTTLVDGTSETDYAFYGYTNLESVSGKGVTDVGVGAFAGIGLTTVDLPAATDIGDGAFYQCTALKTVSLPAVEDIGDGAFAGCTVLKTVSLSEATGIGDNAFDGCYALTTVILPEATDIGTYAFNGCYLLATVILPEATDIGTYAFNECSALETVSLPAVEDIGDGAFASCTALASLTLPAAPATPPTLGSNVFQSTGSSGTLTIYIGSGKISDYTTKWGVAAETAAKGNISKYGGDHKAISIVE